MRVAALEVGGQRRQHIAAEPLGGADAHVPRQGLANARQIFTGGMHRAFHLLGVDEQALAVVRQHEPSTAGLFKQQGVQLGFQRADSARHRGVFHPQLARGGADPLGTGDFQEVPQAIPIQHDFALRRPCAERGAGQFSYCA
ncbi:hypothetical protein D3C73_1201230 [compost metagenome]